MEHNFISVLPDHTYTLHETAKDALNQPALFIAHYHFKELLKTFSESRKMYSYTIVNTDNKSFQFEIDKWIVDKNSIRHYYYYSYRLDFNLSDPLGESRFLVIANTPKSIEAIINLWKYINQFRGFDSWKHYELYLENQQLINEVNSLKNKI